MPFQIRRPRSASVPAALFLSAMAACTPGGLGVSNADECIQKYAVPAGTDQAVRWGHGWCRQIFSDETSEAQRRFAECMVPRLPEVKTSLGLRSVAVECRKP